ncbi:MAG TPA: hypothetical protein VER96_33845 [Polyangiaceae bacterium]|nr:hypothetical protein [Polyangiaceae bacterium]
MPTDYDYSQSSPQTAAAAAWKPKPKPVQLAAPAVAAPAAAAVPAQAPIETPEQQAAREARNATIAGANAPTPSLQFQNWKTPGTAAANVASGNWLPGEYAGQHDDPDAIHPNLSQDQAAAQRKYDFGLGTGNNAATQAMLGNAQATGDKYSAAFSGVANQAAANAAAAQSRGLGVYAGDLSQYGQGLTNAQQSRGLQTSSYDLLNQFAANGTAQQGQQLSALNQFAANGTAQQGAQIDALNQFANGPQGPSAAQAQLTQATDANTQNALALARSGRGMGGSQAALRQAIGQNALTQQQANSQAAELRANEYTAFQNQRLNALNAAGGLTNQRDAQQLSALNAAGGLSNQIGAQQLSALNSAGGLSSQIVGGDQSYGQLGLAGAQYQTDTALKGTQLNDAASQAWADRQAVALQQGMGAEMGSQTQQLNVNASALAGRENEYASANQTYAAEKGFAQAAAIADANRQQAYTAAALNAGGTVIGALSDERTKTNITPLGGSMNGNDVKPLPSQSNGSVFGATPVKMGPTQGELDAQKKDARNEAIGSGAGKAVGGVAGGAIGGPIGAIAGSVLGGIAGKALGKVFSDVRSKTNIRPLDPEPRTAAGGGLGPNGEYLRGDYGAGRRELDRDAFGELNALAQKYGAGGIASNPKQVKSYGAQLADKLGLPFEREAMSADAVERRYGLEQNDRGEVTRLKPEQEAGFRQWLKTNNVRDLDHPDSHYDYRGAYLAGEGRGADSGHFTDRFKQHGHPTFSTQSQYSAGPKDGGDWVGETYLPEAPQGADARTERRFARDESHPILSEGDALLADSARNAPGSTYEYKDPEAPGAKPGMQTGPMAQDLAAHPLTRGMVGKDARTGKLFVDGPRAALTGLAQNHAQQNHIDALGARIDELEQLLPASLKRKKGDERATSFATSTGGL